MIDKPLIDSDVSIGDFMSGMILSRLQSPSSITDEKRLYYAGNPVAFAKEVLGVDIWEKQEEILEYVLNNKRVTVRSCHGAGKSFTAAIVVLWFLICYSPSTVVTTAPTARQVKSILWEEIRLRYKNAKIALGGRLLQMELQMGPKWLATGFATDEYNVERFQGYHNDNILVVIDEACVSSDTEALTNKGWKYFKDITVNDSLLTMNPQTLHTTYRKPTKVYEFDHNGEMYEVDQRGCSFMVTPNHKVLYAKVGGGCKDCYDLSKWRQDEIRNIPNSIAMRRNFVWHGSNRKTIELPFVKLQRKRFDRRWIDIGDWAEFLGWYLSEGNVTKYGVGISQKNIEKKDQIVSIIKKIGYEPHVYGGMNGKGFSIHFSSAQVAKVLSEYGQYAQQKCVPQYIKQASPEVIKRFLDAYADGDGYRRGPNRTIYYTSSKQMADDLQELALKAGYTAKVSPRGNIGEKHWIHDHWATTTSVGYVVDQSRFTRLINVDRDKIKRVQYNGKVYCVEIPPFHTMLIRRNGYVMWTGNSGVARNIFTGVEGLLSSGNAHLLLIGNPTDELSEFGHSFKSPLYKKMHISAFDTPNLKEGYTVRPYLVTPEWVAERKTEWGENDPLYEVRVLGNFPTTSEGALIPLAWFERAKASLAKPEGTKTMGVDIARFGGDESIVYVREGECVIGMWKWTGNDLMESTGKIARIIDETVPSRTNVDAVGVGAGVYDRLIELGYDVYAINGSERAYQSDRYQNLRTEIMWSLKARFENATIRVPDDDRLEHQIVNLRQQSVSSRGQLRMETKEDMKARIGASPDRADALALAFWEPSRQRTALLGSMTDFSDLQKAPETEHELVKIGRELSMKTSPMQMMLSRMGDRQLHECVNCHAQGPTIISWSTSAGMALGPAEATQGKCLVCGFAFEVQH